jgi:hypothetical protein
MDGKIVRFDFKPDVDIGAAEETLHLAMLAAEGLVGSARVRLEGIYWVDETLQRLFVPAGNRVGRIVTRIFAALAAREFGEEAFEVHRVTLGHEGVVATQKPSNNRGDK